VGRNTRLCETLMPSVPRFIEARTILRIGEGVCILIENPSPGPLRLVKAPAAGHPLPQGEGPKPVNRALSLGKGGPRSGG
jgi:hypothetical protein